MSSLSCSLAARRPRPGLLLLLLLLFLSWALAGCGGVAPVLKIGLVAPFEGRYRSVGYDAIYAARLAVREINAAGGIGPYRVALVALDDGGDPALAYDVAASLVTDPAVMAVVGHWLTPTTQLAQGQVYTPAGLPLLSVGVSPFLPADPAGLPADFQSAYAAVTPFDEVAGPYAAPTYDAFYLLFQALARAEAEGQITRVTVTQMLSDVEYPGITGRVYRP